MGAAVGIFVVATKVSHGLVAVADHLEWEGDAGTAKSTLQQERVIAVIFNK